MKAALIDRVFSWIFAAAAVLAVFTGFGNMPLYRRYYIADLPGLGWAGDFFANLHVHYIAGSALVAVAFYAAAVFVHQRKKGLGLTRTGALRALVLVLALVSGFFMALRNVSGIDYPFFAHVGLNFFHIATAVVFMAVTLGCAAFRCRWVQKK